ncbi:hypothetical protein ABXS75_06940 [Roseburia hominis]
MEKYCAITKSQLKHHLWQPFLLSVLLLTASPLVVGIRNLSSEQSAKVLETFVALIGILLFPPVFYPEQDQNVRDTIRAKYTPITSIYLIRLAASVLAAAAMLFVYLWVMKAGRCEMEMGKFYFGTLAEILAFGGLGVFAYGVSDNLVIGYMAPLVYYAVAIGAGGKYLKWFYPFGMLTDYATKHWILAAGIVITVAGIWLRNRKRC